MMEGVPVPKYAIACRPDCERMHVFPPAGVSLEDCAAIELLVSAEGMTGSLIGRRFHAYFRPSKDELDDLNHGAVVELCIIGESIQPFSIMVQPFGLDHDKN